MGSSPESGSVCFPTPMVCWGIWILVLRKNYENTLGEQSHEWISARKSLKATVPARHAEGGKELQRQSSNKRHTYTRHCLLTVSFNLFGNIRLICLWHKTWVLSQLKGLIEITFKGKSTARVWIIFFIWSVNFFYLTICNMNRNNIRLCLVMRYAYYYK